MTGKRKRGRIYYKTDGRCAYCGQDLEPFADWHVEHAIPKSRGGSDRESNLVPACAYCNRRKKSRTPIEFRDYLSHTARERIGNAGMDLGEYLARWGDEESVLKMWDLIHDLQRLVNDTRVKFYHDFAYIDDEPA